VASLRLGSQWISNMISPYMSTMLKSWLGIPRELRIYDMFGIGYPAAAPWPTQRRSLGETVHHERYEEDNARDLEPVQRFLWEDSLLGGWRSSTGLDGRAEQPRE
jgi:hypothetical protein